MVQIIEVLIRIEGETPEAFKERIAAVQIAAATQDLPEGAIGRATITAEGLHADMRWGTADDGIPADTCVIAWWPLAASRGMFVEVDPALISRALRRAEIATQYAGAMRKQYQGGHTGLPGSIHYSFADAILSKNAYALEHLANGMNDVAKACFSSVTGVALPKQQGATWKAIRTWAGVSDAADAVVKAQHKVNVEINFLSSQVSNIHETQAWIRQCIKDGFTRLVNQMGRWVLANEAGTAYDLSKKGSGFAKVRSLIAAEIALAQAMATLSAEQGAKATRAGPAS